MDASIGRLPPQNLDAEQAMLGAMCLQPDSIADVVVVIPIGKVHWLYRPDHRTIYEVLLRLHKGGKPVDLLHVESELRRLNRLEEIGGRDYLIELVQSAPSAANAVYYSELVRNAGVLRDLIGVAREIERKATEAEDDVSVILNDAEVAVLEIGLQRNSRTEPKRLSDVVAHELAAIRKGECRLGMETGLSFFDLKTGGIHRGQFVVIAGRPSLGKTALGLNIFDHISESGGFQFAFFSLEMSESDIARRLIGMRNDRSFVDLIRPDRLSIAERESLAFACEGQWGNVFIESGGGMSLGDLTARVRRLVQRHQTALVVVDYLQLVRDERSSKQTREVEVAAISRGLKALALSLNIAVIALAQINRQSESDKRLPKLSDLRESGAIEQDADVVMFLHREGDHDPRAETETLWLLLEKNRNGQLGREQVVFRKRAMSFHSIMEERAINRAMDPTLYGAAS